MTDSHVVYVLINRADSIGAGIRLRRTQRRGQCPSACKCNGPKKVILKTRTFPHFLKITQDTRDRT